MITGLRDSLHRGTIPRIMKRSETYKAGSAHKVSKNEGIAIPRICLVIYGLALLLWILGLILLFLGAINRSPTGPSFGFIYYSLGMGIGGIILWSWGSALECLFKIANRPQPERLGDKFKAIAADIRVIAEEPKARKEEDARSQLELMKKKWINGDEKLAQ